MFTDNEFMKILKWGDLQKKEGYLPLHEVDSYSTQSTQKYGRKNSLM